MRTVLGLVGGLGLALWAASTTACASGAEERAFTGDPSDAGGGGTGGGASGSGGQGGEAGAPVDLPEDFGEPCELPDDCSSGLCVEGTDGSVCSTTCTGACPDDYDCLPYEGLTGVEDSACIPRLSRLCRPCQDDDDCKRDGVSDDPSRCVSWGDPGSFCGVRCDSKDCPDGYTCEVVTVGAGQSERHCVPEYGQPCSCRPGWSDLGLQTACSVSNSHGICQGTRGCTSGGLTACSADTPVAEVCDGADNNCDDVADEGTCDDGLDCTTDSCKGASGCDNVLASGSCLIDGACFEVGQLNPANPCEACAPTQSQTQWTSKVGACDDGDACTTGDTCVEGVCTGTPEEPDGYEPNDTSGAATALSNTSDCDDYPKATITGTVYGQGDEDWYTYHLEDETFCWIYPRAQLTVPAGSDHDLCLFLTCDNGATPSITCKSGTYTEDFGMRGCCSTNSGASAEDAYLDHGCDGGIGNDDASQIYVRVFNAGSSYTCGEYALAYGDD